jgi:hypothetical protein
LFGGGMGGGGGGGGGMGGALFSNGGTLTLINDTFAGNSAVGGTSGNWFFGGPNIGGNGGGYGGAVFVHNGRLTASFDTFSGNIVDRGGTDVSSNTADRGGTDIYVLCDDAFTPASASLVNDILQTTGSVSDFVAHNTLLGFPPIVSGSSHDLVRVNPSSGGLPASAVISRADPLLGPLQNNGGPTPTMALLPGSPAIGAGVNSNTPPYDQRGPDYPRINDGIIDIGAFEHPVLTHRGNVQVTFDVDPRADRSESSLAVNPLNPDNMVGASKRFIDPATYDFTLAAYATFDGGKTWTEAPPLQLLTHGEGGYTGPTWLGISDPTVAWDNRGDAYLVALPVTALNADATFGMAVYESTDGGRSWGAPKLIHQSPGDDKQWATEDNNPLSPHFGNVYVAWDDGSNLAFARTTDHGATWKGVGTAPVGTPLAFDSYAPNLSVADDGTLYITWLAGNTIKFVKSTDGGNSFSAPAVVAGGIVTLQDAGLPEPDGFPELPGGTFRVLTLPTITTGAAGDVAVAWSDYREGVSRTYYRRSTDGGATWQGPGSGQPLLIGDAASTPDQQDIFPQLARTLNGDIGVAFYEFGPKPGRGSKPFIDVVFSASLDGAATFPNRLTVTSRPWDPTVDAPLSHGHLNTTFIGDYFGLAASPLGFFPFWTDTRDGIQEIFTDEVNFVQANAATFVGQSVPSTMVAGQSYQVSVTMRNTGVTTWTSAQLYRLGSQYPQDNGIWGLGRVGVPGPVAPGQQVTFNFTVTAPANVGTYHFQWRMVQEFVQWFGDYTPDVPVTVVAAGAAVFVGQSVPSVMEAGHSYQVSVTMQNTGGVTWTAGQLYRLGAQDPQDNTLWGLNRVGLPGPVAPGQQVTFNFTVTAPAKAGTYNFQWRMVQEFVQWFGDYTPDVPVAVAPGPATHFRVTSSQAATTAGTALTYTVTALDADNNVATAYTGTVHFASTDPYAVLPPPYTFTAADQGTHTFSVILKTASTQTVTVSGNDLPSGAVSAWRGEGNALDSVGSNNGSLHGGATYAAGEVNQAFRFAGTGDHFQAPTNGLPTGSSNRTLELWVNVQGLPAAEAFLAGYGNFGTAGQTCQLGLSGDRLFFSQWGQAVFGPTLSLGVWHHIAVTNIGDAVTLYLDGVAVASGTLSINTASGSQFYMGSIPGSLGSTRRLQGATDEVTVYNRALSAQEIQDIYLSGSAGKFQTDVGSARVTVMAAPTIVPNLGGLTMNFSTPGLYTNTLAITSVQDQGGATGTFVAVYTDSRDGVVTTVSGTITFKGLAPNPFGLPGYYYDFAVTFSGSEKSHFQFNPRTGIWSYDLSRAGGSGDFLTQAVSGNAGAYSYGLSSIPWSYTGQEADSLTYISSSGDSPLGSYSGSVQTSG